MSIDKTDPANPRHVTRRRVLKVAAWSTPVVAMSVAAPLAVASAGQASIEALVGGNISANSAAGTASGSFLTAGIAIVNVVGTWETGTLNGSYTLTGPWNTGLITKEDGTPFVAGEVITAGGAAWTVAFVESDADGTFRIEFSAASVTVGSNTIVALPRAIYSGTFTPGVPTNRNRIGGTVSVSAANVNGGASVSSASTFP